MIRLLLLSSALTLAPLSAMSQTTQAQTDGVGHGSVGRKEA